MVATVRMEMGKEPVVENKDDTRLSMSNADIPSLTMLCFAKTHDPAAVNTLFSTPKCVTSNTFDGQGKKHIDYIIIRQRDRKLVRDVTLHFQPFLVSISGHNIVSTAFKLISHFSCNRR